MHTFALSGVKTSNFLKFRCVRTDKGRGMSIFRDFGRMSFMDGSLLLRFLPLNLLLVRSHQAEIIIVKRLIQGHNIV